MLQSLLGSVPINILEYGYEIGLDWLGKFAQAIIEGIGIIGLGIVVFTIVLKAIVLPFDIYQRVSMRKQNLVMKEMQPELEKLQKQYANDKTTYNQKMMELYKKNGYSMFGACLPMIFSLVILIVAFQGFRTYSQYANLAMYEKMAQAYSEEVLKFAPEIKDFGDGRTYFVVVEGDTEENLSEGKIRWKEEYNSAEGSIIEGKLVDEQLLSNVQYRIYTGGELRYVEASSPLDNRYITFKYQLKTEEQIKKEQDQNKKNKSKKNNTNANPVKFQYSVDTDKFQDYLEAQGNESEKEVFDKLYETAVADQEEAPYDAAVMDFIVRIGAAKAAEWYRDGNDAHFLWVKNVWYPDVSYQNPIQDYGKFKGQVTTQVTLRDGTPNVALNNVLDKDEYDKYLTSQLTTEKGQANGYFILIILSIGFMVLSQFISMRSSKESNKYQTVDGQGAKTQKMMLIVMPLIYAVFAFMYSAAFSIYMVMSSVISLLTTVFANLIIGRIFKKKEETKAKERVTRKYAWQLTEKEKRAKEKEAKKEAKMQERVERSRKRK